MNSIILKLNIVILQVENIKFMDGKFILFLCLFIGFFGSSQEDLLKEIDTINAEELYQPSFKALQVVTSQSTKIPSKKEFYFVVSHRFGDVSEGFQNFFGLDQATTKIGGIYGITDAISLSISRHTYQKTYEVGAKYRILKQSKSQQSLIDIVGYNVIAVNSELDKDVYPKLQFSDRLTYTNQILLSRRFSDDFSLQITPSFVHKNLINDDIESENNFLVGIGGRYKISKRLSINAEYFNNFNKKDFYINPLSLGLDIETGGHVFQLLFSNSQPNTEAGYLTNGLGDWAKGKVYFGFNLYRVF